MKIPEYIKVMDDKEFLDALDNYDERKGYYYIHEAARRIRQLKGITRHLTSRRSRAAGTCANCPWFPKNNKGIKCPKEVCLNYPPPA